MSGLAAAASKLTPRVAGTMHLQREVKPLLSTSKLEQRRRVLNLYRSWYRQIPYICKWFSHCCFACMKRGIRLFVNYLQWWISKCPWIRTSAARSSRKSSWPMQMFGTCVQSMLLLPRYVSLGMRWLLCRMWIFAGSFWDFVSVNLSRYVDCLIAMVVFRLISYPFSHRLIVLVFSWWWSPFLTVSRLQFLLNLIFFRLIYCILHLSIHVRLDRSIDRLIY